MPIGNINLEFLNHNAERAYPLAADAGATDVSESFDLPESFIVELFVSIHAGLDVDPGRFGIGEIGAYATGYSVTVRYFPADGDSVLVASSQIARSAHTLNQTYNLSGIGDFADCAGRITIGRLAEIDEQPSGLWHFDLEGGRLEADAIRPMIRGIQSISIANGSDISGPYYGDIILRAGTNARIDYSESSGDPVLTFNAIDGEGLQEPCACSPDTTDPIRTINNVAPDADGNLTIVTDNCIDISAIQNGLLLQDLCSQACCGCHELEELTNQLEGFGEQATTLEQFLVQLEASVTQMDLVVLGSRLGDRACVSE